MTASTDLNKKIISASRWSALGEIAAKAITPLVLVILVRLLTPDDFGVIAAAAMVISFSQVFWDAGLSKALIQRESDVDEAAIVIFWTNFVLGLVIYGLLYFSADLVAYVFNDPRIELVLKIQGFQLIFGSLCSVHTALYQRELNFKVLFWVKLFTTALPGMAAIPLAYLGYGYWALVIGMLVGAFTQLVTLWVIRSWRPKWQYNLALAKRLLSYGVWVSGSGVLAWFYLWADSFIIGAYLDTHELGLYRTGNTFVMMIFGLILSPVMPVLFSALSRMQNDLDRLKNAFLSAVKIISIIALPIGVSMTFLHILIAEFFFSNQWNGIEVVISLLGLTHGFAWLVGANGEAFRAIGKPDAEVKIMGLGLVLYLPVYLIAVTYGLEIFLWARLSLVFVAIPIHMYMVNIHLNIHFRDFLQSFRSSLVSAGLMVLIGLTIQEIFFQAVNNTLIHLVPFMIGMLTYVGVLYLLEGSYIKGSLLPLLRRG